MYIKLSLNLFFFVTQFNYECYFFLKSMNNFALLNLTYVYSVPESKFANSSRL